jgi:excisionase family DNA binding protein
MERETLDVRDAAKLLGVQCGTLYKAAAEGTFPAIRIGRRLVIPKRAVDRLLAHGSDELERLRGATRQDA